MHFSVESYGYAKNEVDKAFTLMEQQMKEQKNRIFLLKQEAETLQAELDKQTNNQELQIVSQQLKQSEQNSQKLIETKCAQLEGLLAQYRTLYASLYQKYPFIKNIASVREGIEEFEHQLKNIISDSRKKTRLPGPINTSNDSMRALLDKISKATYASPEPKTIRLDRGATTEDVADRQTQIKPITKLQLSSDDKFETLMEKFLEAETDNLGILEKHLIQTNEKTATHEFGETGFNLKEAVNPKDDLEEIMKAFDFFSSNS